MAINFANQAKWLQVQVVSQVSDLYHLIHLIWFLSAFTLIGDGHGVGEESLLQVAEHFRVQ